MKRQQFTDRAAYVYSVEDGIICIVDRDTGKSVTNDVNNVVADLVHAGVWQRGMPVIYRDTRGVWDQIVVKDGHFHSFAPINERDKDAAKTKLKTQKIRVRGTGSRRIH